MTGRILYIALIISIIGLLILAFTSEILEPPRSNIGEISTNSLGKNVHIQGTVVKIHEFKGGSAIITINDGSGGIDMYLSYNIAKSNPEFLQAKKLGVIGSVEIYQGKLEIIPNDANSIKIIK